MKSRSEIGKYSRKKGQRGENWVVNNVFKPVYPEASRDLNDVLNGRQIDLVNTGLYAVQVKHYAKHKPVSVIDTIVPNEGQVACFVSKPTDRKLEATITFYEDSFLKVCQAYGLFVIQQVSHKNHAPLTALKRTKDLKNGRIDVLLSIPTSDLKNTVTLFLSDFTNLLHSGKFKI